MDVGHGWVRWLVDQRRVRLAWAAWAVVFLVFTAVTIAKPDFRSVTVAYRNASQNWLAGREIYPQRDGEMHYLPQFAILFSPFERLPKAAGDTLWRLLQMGVFVSALRRLATAAQPGRMDLFPLVSLLAAPGALSTVMNGQSNLLLAGAMGHAAVDLMRHRSWAVAGWLIAGLIAKPIGVVMALLVAATDYAVVPWLLGGITLTILAPLAFDTWPTVVGSYDAWFRQLLLIAPSEEPRFEDLAGLLRVLGWHLDPGVWFVIRVAAGGVILAAWRIGSRRLEGLHRVLTLLGLSVGYLMLFNPRTETNSYVILTPAIAVLAARLLAVESSRAGWMLATLAVALGNAGMGNPIWPLTKLWLKPVVAVAFLGWIFRKISRGRPAAVANASDG
jgi:alpha-1,2-mannosyltransferase